MAAATTTTLTLRTGDGLDLEAQLAEPAEPAGAAVLLHPHPLYGGDMRNAVVSELFRALPEVGIAALRLNFRGVGRSGGTHGNGFGERADARAGLDHLAGRYSAAPVWLVGYSFGGDIALAVDDERIAGWVAVAAPLTVTSAEDVVAAEDKRPTLLVVPANDQFRPPAAAREATAGWASTEIAEVPGADHFLVGRVQRVADIVTAHLASAAPRSQS